MACHRQCTHSCSRETITAVEGPRSSTVQWFESHAVCAGTTPAEGMPQGPPSHSPPISFSSRFKCHMIRNCGGTPRTRGFSVPAPAVQAGSGRRLGQTLSEPVGYTRFHSLLRQRPSQRGIWLPASSASSLSPPRPIMYIVLWPRLTCPHSRTLLVSSA